MKEELSFWYTYYDSIFCNPHPTFPIKIALEVNFINEPTTPPIKQKWPKTSCPQLGQCYQYLENFLKSNENWIPSQCTSEELRNIQSNLNLLVHFLELQKNYAQQFWDIDPRRVQASATHFYHFLQHLARSVIPYSSMTIFECKAANKLCLDLCKLQKMMNKTLARINQISQYLSMQIFIEERALTYNFMENLVYFMKKMPTIKRNKIEHITNLTKFVILNNPIEISNKAVEQKKKRKNRKKSNTIGSSYMVQYHSDNLVNHKRRAIVKNMGEITYEIKRSTSFEVKPNLWLMNQIEDNKKKQKYLELPKLFIFPKNISQHSESQKYKNNTLGSLRTLTTKISSFGKKTEQNILSPIHVKRVNTMASKKRMTALKRPKKRSLTKFFEEESERVSLRSISSKNSHTVCLSNNLAVNDKVKRVPDRSHLLQVRLKLAEQILNKQSENPSEKKLDIEVGQINRKGKDDTEKDAQQLIIQRKIEELLSLIEV